jgi:hypothetical protein
MTLVTIVTLGDEYASQLFAFDDALIADSWWSAVTADYSSGTPTSGVHLTGPAISGNVNDSDMVAYIQQVIASGPAPNGNTLYLLYLPDNVQNTDALGACGAHSQYPDASTTIGDAWGWVGRAQSPTCATPVETMLQYLTRAASHEIMEGVTDPTGHSYLLNPGGLPSTPWDYSAWAAIQTGWVELGDLCDYTRIIESDGYDYQRIWSNSAAAAGGDPCAPALAAPYFNISTSYEWYTMPAGYTGGIPIIGWTTATRGPWLLYSGLTPSSTGSFTASLTTNLGTTNLQAGCPTAPAINNSVSGSIQVSVPAGTTSGEWAVIQIVSMDGDFFSCPPPITEDGFHQMFVGVVAQCTYATTSGTCATGQVNCGSSCCSANLPYYCASTNTCYATGDAATAACASSCLYCH